LIDLQSDVPIQQLNVEMAMSETLMLMADKKAYQKRSAKGTEE